MLLAEHFVAPPHWTWYILGYFVLAGIAGGCYAIGTMLRLWGNARDESAARLAFLISLPALIVCPILLTIDLGQPARFWHMMLDTTPGAGGAIFKYWSPMSVGVWGLQLFGIFSFISFLEALALDRRLVTPVTDRLASLLRGGLGRAWNVVGTVFGLFIAGYTGVLLSVSNQPIWSDSFALGGLFVASGMTGSAALMALLMRWRRDAVYTEEKLGLAERYFGVLEVLLLIVFAVTLAAAGTLGRTLGLPWIVLWVLVLLSLVQPIGGLVMRDVSVVRGRGGLGMILVPSVTSAAVSLIGVIALRAAIIFSAQ